MANYDCSPTILGGAATPEFWNSKVNMAAVEMESECRRDSLGIVLPGRESSLQDRCGMVAPFDLRIRQLAPCCPFFPRQFHVQMLSPHIVWMLLGLSCDDVGLVFVVWLLPAKGRQKVPAGPSAKSPQSRRLGERPRRWSWSR